MTATMAGGSRLVDSNVLLEAGRCPKGASALQKQHFQPSPMWWVNTTGRSPTDALELSLSYEIAAHYGDFTQELHRKLFRSPEGVVDKHIHNSSQN